MATPVYRIIKEQEKIIAAAKEISIMKFPSVESILSDAGYNHEAGKIKALCDAVEKMADKVKERLEYLRGELRSELISYGELAELQSLAAHIDPSDVELLEAAGVKEN